MKNYMTKSYKYILNYVECHRDTRFTANDIIHQATEDHCSFDQATIYRNLEKLVKKGVILKFKATGEDSNQYQVVEDMNHCLHHLHLQCRKCGKIIHLDCCFMNTIEEHLVEDHGFSINCNDSVIIGLCQDCQKEED